MYPLIRRAADVALRVLQDTSDYQLCETLAYWVDGQLGRKSDVLAKSIRSHQALALAHEVLTQWDATYASRAEASQVVDDVVKALQGPDELDRTLLDKLSKIAAGSGSASAVVLCEAVAVALGFGTAAFLPVMVSQHLAPTTNLDQWQKQWWATWFTETLDSAYRGAMKHLESTHLLSEYFCGTMNHVIAPDMDMHIALEKDTLHFVAIGTQFDLRRPARMSKYQAPCAIDVNWTPFSEPLLAADWETLNLMPEKVDDWKLQRPVESHWLPRNGWFSRRPRRDPALPDSAIVADDPRHRSIAPATVRRANVRAVAQGVMAAHLVVQLDLGEKRPLKLTVFGRHEMWAALWILHQWLDDKLSIDVVWSDVDWAFANR